MTTRREFLATTAALPFLPPPASRNCILVWMTGGPSQLETFDPKPDAPRDIRGPFGAIPTNVPGIRISALLPNLARDADKYTLIRSLHHDAPIPPPSLPFRPATFDTAPTLLESATPQYLRIDMPEHSWDIHGWHHYPGFAHLRDVTAPAFDRGLSHLLTSLDERGLLASTLVIAMGEFGRTPRLNPDGGRDHWPACCSVLLAGTGLPGGEVLGASCPHAAEPRDNPLTPADLTAMIRRALFE